MLVIVVPYKKKTALPTNLTVFCKGLKGLALIVIFSDVIDLLLNTIEGPPTLTSKKVKPNHLPTEELRQDSFKDDT